MTDKVEVFRRTDKLWDWRRIAENGQFVSTSGSQGYVHRGFAFEQAEKLNPGLEVTVTEGEKA